MSLSIKVGHFLTGINPRPLFGKGRSRSAEADADDFVGARAARRADLDRIADGLADQGARQRRMDRQAAGADIGLMLAYDLIDALIVAILVGQGDGGAETHRIARDRKSGV